MVNIGHPLYREDLKYATEYIRGRLIESETKSVLIIGATGLIGSFLTDVLVYYNRNVKKQFDIWAMGRSMKRLQDRFSYAGEGELYLWEHDINLPLETDVKFDYIFHLASNADPGTYKKYPVETITTNVLGAVHVIEYAKRHTDTRILFTSTMEVYGESEEETLSENAIGALNFNEVRAGYPESKRVSELLYHSAHIQYGVWAVVVRLGYIYGPTMTESDNKVVAEFVRNAACGKDLELQSAGLQRRSYCYVADAVTGMLAALFFGDAGEAYNVADEGSVLTIRQLAELIAEAAKVKLILQSNEITQDEKRRAGDKVLDARKLKQLGWNARNEIEVGIGRTLEIIR